jgi:hypothetical protein
MPVSIASENLATSCRAVGSILDARSCLGDAALAATARQHPDVEATIVHALYE